MSQKIMVVDDDPGNIRLVESICQRAGYTNIVSAEDGLDALVKIKKEKPDLVVLDIMMPEVNGYDVCYQLRFNKDYKEIPIIILTVQDKELDDSISSRVNIEYMQKPVEAEALIKNVKKFLP